MATTAAETAGQIERYGILWPKGFNLLDIELTAFRYAPPDGGHARVFAQDATFKEKSRHFKNIVATLWPKTINGKPNPKYFEFHPWAEKMLEEACRENYLGVAGCGSSGKCLAPHTPVLMFDGTIRRADEVQVGDQLMGDDSTPRNVKAANPGRSNMVRIVPVLGDPWECNDDHILTIQRSWAGERSRHLVGTVIDISVKDYLARSQTFRDQHALFCVGVEFPSQPVDFDPYIYGLWLGDGHKGRSIISSSDKETGVNEKLVQFAVDHGYHISLGDVQPGVCPNWYFSRPGSNKNPFVDLARESCGMQVGDSCAGKEKRILRRYLVNDRGTRLKVLAGIIDSDGYASSTYFEVACSTDGLTQDIAFLARSLGFRVTITPRIVRCNGKDCQTNRINIMGNVQEIPTTRKKCAVKKLRQNSHCTNFKVEQLGEGDWYGFELDGNGRFLLGDFTVTHNTRFFAMWAIVNYVCDPRRTLVIVVSTSLKDSRERIWGAIEEYWLSCPGLPGKLVSSLGRIRFQVPGIPDNPEILSGITLVAGDKSKAKEAAANLIGKKSPRVILIADEHTELAESINEAAFGNLALNPWFQFIGIGNPKSYYDAFGQFITPKHGYESIHAEMTEWETRYGKCIRFDGLKSPNWLAGKNVYGYLIKVEDIKRAMDNYGPNSPAFWRMYRGFFCPSADEQTLFSEADIVKFGGTKSVTWLDEPIDLAALDPAHKSGGDEAPIYFGKLGTEAETKLKVLLLTECVILHEDSTDQETPFNFQIAEGFKRECQRRNIPPEQAAMDATNIPFADIVSQVWSPKVWRTYFGGGPTLRPLSEFTDDSAKDRCSNRVTEIWMAGHELLKHGQLRGLTPSVIEQLVERQISLSKTSTMKFTVESKRDMKARIGRSPDRADAAMILVDLVRERFRGKRIRSRAGGNGGRSWTNVAKRVDVTAAKLLS